MVKVCGICWLKSLSVERCYGCSEVSFRAVDGRRLVPSTGFAIHVLRDAVDYVSASVRQLHGKELEDIFGGRRKHF